MSNLLGELLATRDWLMADGATGTNLFNAGLPTGEAPELWNFDAPDRIRDLYRGSVEAGSDIILTNSFGGTANRLKLHGLEARVQEVNARAAELAREVVDGAGRPVVVAGSMGPTGELLEPLGPLSFEAAVAAFEAQARGLLAGGVDVLWAETMSSEEEMRAAAQAAANLGAPFCGTMSFDTAGRTMMGITPPALAGLAAGLPALPLAFGANCGVGASDLLRTVLGITAAAPGAVVVAKGNAGIPRYVDGHIHYDGTPELMADYAVLARDCGARIIGGCCGTTPAHLAAMRAALESTPPGPRPTLETISERLGGFSSATDGASEAAPARERRRRRA
ncbi:betaine--homocysteine S-methyltransferase [Oceanicella sp. SM1341]|uniref:betaine--homocysteine S-methyltransferase n=1 Tax=Oceanicella sp. SM1341 TaxID=1548889 RepID=UPI000E4A19DF|nr:betaine--homocysteine S-methyltransferase [Oceanicella sp. SM1341]